MGFSTRRAGPAAACLWLLSFALHAQVNVTTYHNDNSRTGENLNEMILTPANVGSTQFGKLFTVAVDGVVYAQPLYLSNIGIGAGTHNVVFVATQHDSVYAMDADTGTVYWHVSLIPAGGSTVSASADLACGDITGEVGITGTPVIDANSGTLYVVAKVKLNGVIAQHLHALSVNTGAEKFGGPNTIQASVAGGASDGDGSIVTFNPRQENQRAALLLENGHVIVAWTSHCDSSPWHGWVMSFGAGTLTQEGVYNSSANGYGNGIWMSGGGLAADGSGNIFFATGNGTWNATDQGDSIVKLGAPTGSKLPVLDYFTPYNQGSLATDDADLSAGGVILLPTLPNGQQLLVSMGKQGKIYLLDRTNLGKYCITQSPACTSSDPQIVQEISGVLTGLWGVPAYWNGNVYWGGGNDNNGLAEAIKAYSFNAGGSGKMSTTATSVTSKLFNFSGPVPSISANGNSNAILWGLDNGKARSTCVNGANCQILYAYDATNLKTLLYSSSTAANDRDVPGGAVKFVTPTIANGKVYVASVGAVSVYGLLSNTPTAAAAPSYSPSPGAYTSGQQVTLSDVTPNAAIYYTTDGTNPTAGSAAYAGPLTLSASTTIKALALSTGYTSSAVTSGTYTISAIKPSGGATPVSLKLADNVYGIDQNGATAATGGMDTYGDSYAAALLGTTVTWSGITFNLGVAGSPSAVANATIALPPGTFTTLNLLGTAVHAAQVNQKFVVSYTDGTATTVTQSLSDWFTPQNYSGESIAMSMPYRLNSTGAQQTGPFYLYGYSFAINGAKTVKSIALPSNRDVVILAATLSGAVTGGSGTGGGKSSVITTVNLSTVDAVNAIFYDGTAVTNGGLDSYGSAYSETLLGTSLTWSGVTFSLGAAGVVDAATQITVPLPAGNFSTLKLLATGSHGNQVGQIFTVTYTDGSTTQIMQSLSDWFTPQSYNGESIASTMDYRLTMSGGMDGRTFYLYGYALPINNAKTVKSITLPSNRHVVVLAATLIP